MTLFLTTVALFAAAFVLHIVIWKIRIPRRQLPALVVVFGLVFLAWAVFAFFDGFSLVPLLHVGLYYVACSFCYFIIYTTIEADSPTLSLMRFIARHEPNGVPAQEVEQFLTRRPFVQARLTALLQSGDVRERDGRYEIAGKPSLFFGLILAFRKLYGPISKGG